MTAGTVIVVAWGLSYGGLELVRANKVTPEKVRRFLHDTDFAQDDGAAQV
jgi:hypothetical protein